MGREAQSPVRDLFTEARPVRSFEDIAIQIQRAISNGRLKEGDRLPSERDLGRTFGVSRPTLREALRFLEGAGVIVVRRGATGGIFVTEPKPDQVGQALEALIRFRGATAAELAEFRGSFEGETAFWAAKRATPDQIDRLRELGYEYHRQAEDVDSRWAILVDLDVSFHDQVAVASQNQVRVAIMFGIHRALYNVSLALQPRADHDFRLREAAELRGIAEAISRHQAPVARRLMRRHVLWNAELESLEQNDVPEGPVS